MTAFVVPAHFAKLHVYVIRTAYEAGGSHPCAWLADGVMHMGFCGAYITITTDGTTYTVYDEDSKLDSAIFMEVPRSYWFTRTGYAWVCGVCRREPTNTPITYCNNCDAKRDIKFRLRGLSLYSTYLLLKEVLCKDLAAYTARFIYEMMVHRELR